MTASVDPRRLAHIEGIDLDRGQHAALAQGACLMEAAAYMAGERWSDAPQCASPVIGGLLRTWNDLLPRRPRQELKRHLPRVVGSRGTPAQENQRAALAVNWFQAGPGQNLPAGRRGRQIVGAAIEMARQHASDTTPLPGELILPDPPRRVPRQVLDAVHDLIDQLLAITDAPTGRQPARERPVDKAADVPRDAVAGAEPAPDPARHDAATTAPVPVVAPGPHRAPRPRRPARRAPVRRGGLPPTLPAVLPPVVHGPDPNRPGRAARSRTARPTPNPPALWAKPSRPTGRRLTDDPRSAIRPRR
jgi:hypothetical protein